jgi:hypothetical protein
MVASSRVACFAGSPGPSPWLLFNLWRLLYAGLFGSVVSLQQTHSNLTTINGFCPIKNLIQIIWSRKHQTNIRHWEFAPVVFGLECDLGLVPPWCFYSQWLLKVRKTPK